jgi:hypothetical protein
MLQGGDFTRHNVSSRHTRHHPRRTRYPHIAFWGPCSFTLP